MKTIIENEFSEHLKVSQIIISLTDNVEIAAKFCINSLENDGKILIFGNGGSAAIASHFSVDLTKNARVRCVNYNESDLLTCFSNDFGYEKWVEKAINFYGDPGDVLIIISTGGKSQNIVNGCKAAKKKKFKLKALEKIIYTKLRMHKED